MSKLDANSGFWQIPLAKNCCELTTFITPLGRYCFNKLPFGISSAPEHFQKKMSTIVDGLVGVLCLMDDILIFGKDQKEHDTRLTAALERIQAAGVILNKDKCELSLPPEDSSNQQHGFAQVYHRTKKFSGDGKSVRKILSTNC